MSDGFEVLLFFFLYQHYFGDDEEPQMSLEDKRRRDRRYPRIALKSFHYSAFVQLYHSGNDQSLLNCCGVDHKIFRELLALFEPVYDRFTVDKWTGEIRLRKPQGRPRELDAIGALGLVLFWYRTRGSCARAIAFPFGLTATPMYQWLKFGRRVLLSVLQNVDVAKCQPPTNEEVDRYVEAISAKYPVLAPFRVWGAVDGLKLRLQQSSNWALQNMYYNAWTEGCYVSSVLVFAPDGRIRFCVINVPGSYHDSNIADHGLYDKMEEVFDRTGGRIVVDAAFKICAKRFLLRSAQNAPMNATLGEHRVNQAATSVRQLSEHGMRMLQGQFPRLKDSIRFDSTDELDRRVSLHLMILLYNYQTARVGINQILNTYMSETPGLNYYAYTSAGERSQVDETADFLFFGGTDYIGDR